MNEGIEGKRNERLLHSFRLGVEVIFAVPGFTIESQEPHGTEKEREEHILCIPHIKFVHIFPISLCNNAFFSMLLRKVHNSL